jgi:hypothetical protein
MSYPRDDRDPYPRDPRDRPPLTGPDTAAIWKRGLAMLLLALGVGLAQSLLYAIALVQFAWMLIKRERNGFLAGFGRSLGLWLAEAAWFLSGDSDDKPFPWREWPRS